MIRLVVGLGNPGEEYKDTRHNIGFLVVDAFARKLRLKGEKTKCLSRIIRGRAGGRELILAKPLTYMNNSGLAVENIIEEEEIEPSEMIVVYDDIDLPVGATRLRLGGSSGGHKGMESIIRTVGTQDFPRLRIGIGRPKRKEDVVSWVLSPFDEDEIPLIKSAIERAVKCLERCILLGPQEAMDLCNSRS